MTYTMDIETDAVRQHPFHLGTIESVAVRFVLEALQRDGVKSVALRRDGKLVKIYDRRDSASNS